MIGDPIRIGHAEYRGATGVIIRELSSETDERRIFLIALDKPRSFRTHRRSPHTIVQEVVALYDDEFEVT